MKFFVFVIVFCNLLLVAAPNLSQQFSFEGQLLDVGQNPYVGQVYFRFSIRNPTGTHLLYQEEQVIELMFDDIGFVNLKIGSAVGSSKRTGSDPGYSMQQVFQNYVPLDSYSPASGDGRNLTVQISTDGFTYETLSPAMELGASPQSLVAQTAQRLQNYLPSDFLLLTGGTLAGALTAPEIAVTTGPLTVNGINVCLHDGTNCPAGASGTVTSITAGSGLAGGTITTTGTISIADGGVTSTHIADGTIVNNDINAAAAIDVTKIGTGSINNTVFGHLAGVTSSIQTQLNSKSDVAHNHSANDITLGTLAVARGGTGQVSYTNGQLLIGNTTGNTLERANLTAGTGVSIVNGAGSITISAENNGTITNVATGTGLTGGPITTTGTISMADMPADTIKGRLASTGAPQDLSANDVKNMLGLNNVENTALSTWSGSTNITALGTIANNFSAPRITLSDGVISLIISGPVQGNLRPSATGYNLGQNSAITWANVFGVNAYTTTSDIRQKKDIKDIEFGLDFIAGLRPVEYRWKDKKIDQKYHFGFIAQEVEDLIDHKDFGLIEYSKDNDHYMLRYNELIAPMIKALQELKNENDRLEKKAKNLEERLVAVEEILSLLLKKDL